MSMHCSKAFTTSARCVSLMISIFTFWLLLLLQDWFLSTYQFDAVTVAFSTIYFPPRTYILMGTSPLHTQIHNFTHIWLLESQSKAQSPLHMHTDTKNTTTIKDSLYTKQMYRIWKNCNLWSNCFINKRKTFHWKSWQEKNRSITKTLD